MTVMLSQSLRIRQSEAFQHRGSFPACRRTAVINDGIVEWARAYGVKDVRTLVMKRPPLVYSHMACYIMPCVLKEARHEHC
jgi:hypothetical protein